MSLPRSKVSRPKGKGYALMLVLLVGSLFMMLAGAIGSEVLTAQRTTKTRLSTSAARFAAYAGLQHAVLLLKQNPAYVDTDEELVCRLMPESQTVSYTVIITNNYGSASSLTLDDGTVVPPRSVYCAAMGVDDGKAGVALHAMSGILSNENPRLSYAAFSDSSLELLGENECGSFTADSGFTYDSEGRAVPDSPGELGNLGTNRRISLDDGATVTGTISRPADQANNIPSQLSASADILDLTSPVDIPKYSPPVARTEVAQAVVTGVDVSNGVSQNTNANNTNANNPNPNANVIATEQVNLTDDNTPAIVAEVLLAPPTAEDTRVVNLLKIAEGETVTVPPGRYFFPDGMEIHGNLVPSAAVDENNPIVFYVGGDTIIGGTARVNVGNAARPGEASQLQMFFVDQSKEKQEFKMTGTSQLLGTVVGNRVEGVFENDAQLLGGFLGRSVTARDQAKLLFDEQLSATPLEVAANWGLNGITEPKPEVVMRFYTAIENHVLMVKQGNPVYQPAAGYLPNNSPQNG